MRFKHILTRPDPTREISNTPPDPNPTRPVRFGTSLVIRPAGRVMAHETPCKNKICEVGEQDRSLPQKKLKKAGNRKFTSTDLDIGSQQTDAMSATAKKHRRRHVSHLCKSQQVLELARLGVLVHFPVREQHERREALPRQQITFSHAK